MLVLCLFRVSRVFSRYPFSCHGVLLVSTHAVSRALTFLMFHAFSVLLLSFYLVLCLSRVSRVFFSVPVLVPCRSVSVVPAIVNSCLGKKHIFDTCESAFFQKMLVLCLSRVSRVFSRYPFSCHGVLLVSTHAVSRALRFLMFHVSSVLLLSFYLAIFELKVRFAL